MAAAEKKTSVEEELDDDSLDQVSGGALRNARPTTTVDISKKVQENV